jgi:hypothetical protein
MKMKVDFHEPIVNDCLLIGFEACLAQDFPFPNELGHGTLH